MSAALKFYRGTNDVNEEIDEINKENQLTSQLTGTILVV